MSAPRVSTSRRAFLAAVATATAACRAGQSRPPGQPPEPAVVPDVASPATARTSAIDAEVFASAEAVAGVEFTPDERALMLRSVDDQLAALAARRGFAPGFDVAPATVFDPRLASVPSPSGKDAMRGSVVSAAKPKTDADLAYASLPQLADWLRRRVVTSRGLTDLYLSRLSDLGAKLECVVTPTADLGHQQAERADQDFARGRVRSRLQGIPWGAKDLFDTAGIATTWGAEPYRERVPTADAVVVQRLQAAGAVLVAKLTTGAIAYGDIWFGGRTRNPWNLNEGASGSSAGPAAAVAAGLVGFALGTETLGSIVSPSLRCGATGLRPTFGHVPRTGCMPLCWSLDKVGPIARNVEDTAWVLAAIHGHDPGDPGSISAPLRFDGSSALRKLRVGFDPAWFEADDVQAPAQAALAAMRRLPVDLVELKMPELPYDGLILILLVEAAAAFESLTTSGDDDSLAWQGENAWPNTFRLARFIPGIDYVAAQRLRRVTMQRFAEVFEGVDALIGPSQANSMLLATNCTGHPCLTLPTGFIESAPRPELDGKEVATDTTPKRVPEGVSLWGRLFDEGRLCRLGMALEQEIGLGERRPV